jgi:glycosyltransferase involved in cell wall biosynthesis
VHVVPNGIDTDVFAPGDRDRARAEIGLDDRLHFVWLGRMYRGKGVEVAIDALARVDESVCLLLVGDGESRAALEARVAATGLGQRVRFVGSQPRERIPTYLRAADAFVFPSLLPEAAPLAPLQAMSLGLPVVASRIGSLPELVDRPWSNGVLVEPGDVGALADAMARLAADEGLRARLGGAARDRVLAEYTIDRMIERTLGVYDLARRRSRER